MQTIYIDRKTATWGDPQDLRFVEVNVDTLQDLESGMSDSDIIELTYQTLS